MRVEEEEVFVVMGNQLALLEPQDLQGVNFEEGEVCYAHEA